MAEPTPNRNPKHTLILTLTQHDADYHQYLTVSSVATFPPNFVKKWLSSFCIILQTSKETNY